MLYKDIYNIINSYLEKIQIVNHYIIKYKCTQCRIYFPQYLLKQTVRQEYYYENGPRIFCNKCRKLYKLDFMFNYTEFK
jgi:hypothetical protein